MRGVDPEPAVLIERYIELARSVLPEEWERSLRWKNHPAAQRVRALRALLASGARVRLPEEEPLLALLGEAILDSRGLVHPPGGDEVAIASTASTPEGSLDSLVGMLVGAWHRDQGHAVSVIEGGEYPDLRVAVPGQQREMLVACKRLRTPTSGRIEKELVEMDERFRLRGSNDLAVGVLHFSLPIERAVDPEAVPPIIHFARARAKDGFTTGKLRRTDCIVFCWDDYGYDPASPHVVVTLRRRARSVLRPGPIDDALRPYGGDLVDIAVNGRGDRPANGP